MPLSKETNQPNLISSQLLTSILFNSVIYWSRHFSLVSLCNTTMYVFICWRAMITWLQLPVHFLLPVHILFLSISCRLFNHYQLGLNGKLSESNGAFNISRWEFLINSRAVLVTWIRAWSQFDPEFNCLSSYWLVELTAFFHWGLNLNATLHYRKQIPPIY